MDISRVLFSEIENSRTRVSLGTANDLKQFRQVASQINAVRALKAYTANMQDEVNPHRKLAFRVAELLNERHPVEYAHPCDHAVAIYLDILHELRSPYAPGLATSVYVHTQLFWGRQIAREAIVGEVFIVV